MIRVYLIIGFSYSYFIKQGFIHACVAVICHICPWAGCHRFSAGVICPFSTLAWSTVWPATSSWLTASSVKLWRSLRLTRSCCTRLASSHSTITSRLPATLFMLAVAGNELLIRHTYVCYTVSNKMTKQLIKGRSSRDIMTKCEKVTHRTIYSQNIGPETCIRTVKSLACRSPGNIFRQCSMVTRGAQVAGNNIYVQTHCYCTLIIILNLCST